MKYKELFKIELTEVNVSYLSQAALFQEIAEKLFHLGFVKDSFGAAVTEREAKYPTGLEIDEMSVAIPHTNVEHVLKPFVYVIKLREPLTFIKMGTDDEPLPVSSVFVLGIKQPQEQVGLLAGFIDLLQDQTFVQQFRQTDDPQELNNLIKLTFRSEER